MVRRILLLALIASPALCAADKTTETMLEILRDLNGLEQQIKALQNSLDNKVADIKGAAADQARMVADQSAKSVAAINESVQKSLQSQQNQQNRTLDAVAAMGSQVQSISDQLGTLRQAVSDLTAAMSRLSTQVNDLTTAVKTPPAGPPPAPSATDLFNSAEGDRLGGKLDLALQEYGEYVNRFGDSPQAPDAQYYVGSINYSNQDWDDAVKAFNALLQKYPDSKRTPETLYYKADSLARLGRGQEASETLKELRRRFPDNSFGRQGLSVKQK